MSQQFSINDRVRLNALGKRKLQSKYANSIGTIVKVTTWSKDVMRIKWDDGPESGRIYSIHIRYLELVNNKPYIK